MASFNERLNRLVGPRGYDVSLRRSIQSVILYEANRCLADLEARRLAEHLPGLRAFQRKVVLWETAKNILDATDLLPHQKEEIMWRTGTSKQPLGHETAWKRAKMTDKELVTLADRIRPFQIAGRSSDEALDAYIQSQYVRGYIRWIALR